MVQTTGLAKPCEDLPWTRRLAAIEAQLRQGPYLQPLDAAPAEPLLHSLHSSPLLWPPSGLLLTTGILQIQLSDSFSDVNSLPSVTLLAILNIHAIHFPLATAVRTMALTCLFARIETLARPPVQSMILPSWNPWAVSNATENSPAATVSYHLLTTPPFPISLSCALGLMDMAGTP
jgi:hypothetical protein